MKKIKKILSIIPIFAILIIMPTYASKLDIEKAKENISNYQKEIKEAKDEVGDLSEQKSDINSKIEKLDKEMSNLSKELTELNDKSQVKEKEIEVADANLSEAQEIATKQFEDMKLRIKYMYETPKLSFIELILNSNSMQTLLNRAEYISKISNYDREKLTEYEQSIKVVEEAKAILEKEKQELDTLAEATKQKQKEVDSLLAKKRQELSAVNKQIEEANENISEYNAKIGEQEALIAKVEAEIKRKEEEARKREEEARKKAAEEKRLSVKSIGEISFLWPVPSKRVISSRFGNRKSPTEGASSYHQGIDIPAPTGTAIVAAADGEVSIASYSPSAGNYVMLNHGNGIFTVYMHCAALMVSEGQKVSKGQTIASVGSTGYSTGAHLHFGIRTGGKYVNPETYVAP